MSPMKISLWGGAGILMLYFSACTYVSAKKSAAFESVNAGDPEGVVIRALGEPSVREHPDVLFSRYASTACQEPCTERLWYENRLSFDIEAWSIELDSKRRVLDKTHWQSP